MSSFRTILPSLVALAALLGAGARGDAEVHLTVGQGGQHATIQSAVDAVPTGGAERYVIDILPGDYSARVKVPSNKPKITLRGQDPLTTKITFNETANTPPNESTVHATVVVQGADFIAENLTFENSYGPGVQALALYAKADRMIFNNCRFLGWQDTLRSEFGRHYFKDVYVEGSVDYVYGKGTAYFEDATLYSKANGYLTAQARESADETNGFVFKNATITGSANAGSVYLGRPWQPYSRTVFIDSKMGPLVNPAGWATWSGNNHLTAYYAEHNSMDLNGDPLNVAGRVGWSHQLTAAEAEAYSRTNWLGGADNWDPYAILFPPALPGDFNDDGVVDAADYTVWRDNLGGTFDLNGNGNETGGSAGFVDDDDYALWRSNFGATHAVALQPEAIPEPSSLFLVLYGASTALRAARRR